MRIAIVNDQPLAVEATRRVLLNAEGHKLAWVAGNGMEAVEHCAQDTPDLVLMDLIMPQMDGVEATRQIMSRSPCAIVVVTASVEHNSSKVFEAMGAGALDAVDTPTLDRSGGFANMDALLGKIRMIHRLIGAEREPGPCVNWTSRSRLVAIGASAGGPTALARMLSQLPANFFAPLVIVQHLETSFAGDLAKWLNDHAELPVRLAEEGDEPASGEVLLAGRDQHLVFNPSGRLEYSNQPEDSPYRPSIDVFFRSVRQHWNGGVIGVLLTGMGRDGSQGLKELHDAGHHTIVQSRASSAVYGMPKAAAELKAASQILPLERIGKRLAALLMGAKE